MQVAPEKSNTVSSGGFESVLMGIDPSNLSQVAHMFRNQIYSYAEKAVAREYLCNALDEHVTHKIQRPVEVTLTHSSLKVRDFALGLPKHKVLNIFFQYLASTKTGEEHGGFGIGAKAGHAYSDIFYVTSHFDGEKTMYAGVLEDRGGPFPDGIVNVLSTEPSCETGIEVEVPIKERDFNTFEAIFSNIGEFSKNQFLFNGKLLGGVVPDGYTNFEDKFLFEKGGDEVSVRLGDIVYPTHKSVRVAKSYGKLIILAESVNDCSVPPSRESIKMDAKTEAWVDKKIEEFKAKFYETLVTQFEAADTLWEKADLHGKFDLPVDMKEINETVEELFKKPSTFKRHDNYSAKYAGIVDVYPYDRAKGFTERSYFLHWGMTKIRMEYFARISHSPIFVEFNDKSEAEDWARQLGIPPEKVTFFDTVTFPKTQRSTEVYVYRKYARSNQWDGNRHPLDDSKVEYYVEGFRNKPQLKFPAELYKSFEIVMVNKSNLKDLPEDWIHADSVVEKKLLDIRQEVSDNIKEYVKNSLISNYQYSDVIHRYFKFKGYKHIIKAKVNPFAIENENHIPEIAEANKTAAKIVSKIKTKTDTWQFRAVMALSNLSESEYQLAKTKILS